MGFRTRAACFTAGTAGRTGGRKDQKRRSSSEIITLRAAPSTSRYVLTSRPIDAPPHANAVVVDVEIVDGALSVGVLDVDAQRFTSVAVRTTRGRHHLLLLGDPLPARFQIIVSNHQPSGAAPGLFVFHGARVLERPFAALPRTRASAT